MKLEQQVCSLDLAKKLRELGVKRESAFYWVEHHEIHRKQIGGNSGLFVPEVGVSNIGEFMLRFGDELGGFARHRISAFTVAELGEMLPEGIQVNKGYKQGPTKSYDWWTVSTPNFALAYQNAEGANTEADARAKMLIYLIEKGIINPTEKRKV